MSVALVVATASLYAAQYSDRSALSVRHTRMMVHEYGGCLLKKQHKRASAAILANVDNGQLMERYPALIDGKCIPTPIGLTTRVRFNGDQFRYALADALVRREFATQPAPNLEAVAPLGHQAPSPPLKVNAKGKQLSEREYQQALEGFRRSEAFSYLSRYGECVVRIDPVTSRALLLTDPESAQEESQFAAMSKALSTCVQEGSTLKFNKMSLRGTVAVNYYRLAVAARQQSAAGGAR